MEAILRPESQVHADVADHPSAWGEQPSPQLEDRNAELAEAHGLADRAGQKPDADSAGKEAAGSRPSREGESVSRLARRGGGAPR